MEGIINISETTDFVCIKILELSFHGISLYFDFYFPSSNDLGNKSDFLVS